MGHLSVDATNDLMSNMSSFHFLFLSKKCIQYITKCKNMDPKAKGVARDKKKKNLEINVHVCNFVSGRSSSDECFFAYQPNLCSHCQLMCRSLRAFTLERAETHRHNLLCSNWSITSQSLEPHQLEEGRTTAELLILIVLVQTH